MQEATVLKSNPDHTCCCRCAFCRHVVCSTMTFSFWLQLLKSWQILAQPCGLAFTAFGWVQPCGLGLPCGANMEGQALQARLLAIMACYASLRSLAVVPCQNDRTPCGSSLLASPNPVVYPPSPQKVWVLLGSFFGMVK